MATVKAKSKTVKASKKPSNTKFKPAEWWLKLDKAQQKAYIKEHPKSKYAALIRGGKGLARYGAELKQKAEDKDKPSNTKYSEEEFPKEIKSLLDKIKLNATPDPHNRDSVSRYWESTPGNWGNRPTAAQAKVLTDKRDKIIKTLVDNKYQVISHGLWSDTYSNGKTKVTVGIKRVQTGSIDDDELIVTVGKASSQD